MSTVASDVGYPAVTNATNAGRFAGNEKNDRSNVRDQKLNHGYLPRTSRTDL